MGKGSRLIRKRRRTKAFELLYSKKGKRSLAHILKDKVSPTRSKILMAVYWKRIKQNTLRKLSLV